MNIKKYCFLFQILFIFTVQAASTSGSFQPGSRLSGPDPVRQSIPPWMMRVSFAPDLGYRRLKATDTTSEAIAGVRNAEERPMVGYTTGLGIEWQIASNWFFQPGLYYTKRGYQTRERMLIFVTGPGALAITRSIYQYLELPLVMGYRLNHSSVSIRLNAGPSLGFFLANPTKTIYTQTRGVNSGSTFGTIGNKVLISAYGSAHFALAIHARFEAFLEPYFRYGLNPVNPTPVKEYLWNGGMHIGFNFRLK